ncbi:hypothetical protein [Escherichia coli]
MSQKDIAAKEGLSQAKVTRALRQRVLRKN